MGRTNESMSGSGRRSTRKSTCDCNNINVHFTDTYGTSFEAKLFYSRFLNLDDEYEIVVGICEIGGQRIQSTDTFEVAPLPSMAFTSTVDSKSDDASSTEDTVSPLRSLSPKEPEVNAIVDPFSPELTIIDCSDGFTELCHAAPTRSGLRWLVVDDQNFFEWVQECVNALEVNTRYKFGRLTLRPPGPARLGYQYRATCTMTLFHSETDETCCVEDPSSSSSGEDADLELPVVQPLEEWDEDIDTLQATVVFRKIKRQRIPTSLPKRVEVPQLE